MTGGDVASQPELAGATTDDLQVANDDVLSDEKRGDASGGDKQPDPDDDWSQYSVHVGNDDSSDEIAGGDDESGDKTESAGDSSISGSAAVEGEDGKADDLPICKDGAVKRDGVCVTIGAPPTHSGDGCPDGAVVLGNQCYEVVPPTCGELEVAPGGQGCLKLVAEAGTHGACPDYYELSEDGETCVKTKSATVACTQGTPVGDSCLIEQEPVGGDSAGCSGEQLQIGNNCYELSNPDFDCGDLAELPNGNCRFPVDAQETSGCADGLEPWENICYRYEDPPTYDCGDGEPDGEGWCHIIEEGNPGPDVCDDGVLQDDDGCYVLSEPDEEGTCGELAEFEGMCREAKPSYPTWICSDGATVYEPTCDLWVEAESASCAIGQLVENDTKCKTIEDKIVTEGCPSYASEDSEGCYKSKEPSVTCGELAIAPDGEHCKQWVSEADGGGECSAGFELVGGTTCKKWLEGSPGCPEGEPIEVGGKLKCRFTTAAGDATQGCAAGMIEEAGNCYKIVPASCAELEADVYGGGCKKLIEPSDESECETGYTLVADECIKP